MVIGFFMILVDTTIVGVANPAIKEALDPTSNSLDRVVWVTSAYLLAYAVPLLITGRLGDRFGPKNLYLIGLAVFTLASLWCGLSTTLDGLIWARAVQGLGAALLTPQTMAVITRTFPPERRGAAMGLWGAASGVAMLVGPLAGGFLVDGLGWEWIFFINLPVGVIGFILACILVPKLQTHKHRFDVPGVFLSAIALFLIVFGLQEAEAYDWGVIWGPISVWSLIITGVVVLVLFLWYQSRTKNEPLVPLELFRNRNFAWSNITIAIVGFTVTAQGLPLMFFLQLARGLTPTESALLLIPMAIAAGVISPFAGKLLDRIDPRLMLVPGLLLVSISLFLFATMMNTEIPIGWLLVPSLILGFGNAGMWGPLATTATRDLPPRQAGAGSGIYNTMRTVGSVLGSAAIAAFMQNRLETNLPGASDATGGFGGGQMPDAVAGPFADAMAQTMLLPAAVILLGVAAMLVLRRPKHLAARASRASRTDRGGVA
ncbi:MULTISPECIES: DHA2 family efflux MFS transporter permease subunit [Microbacterium]|uniref:DHA2 family efflux MFS transporter permease subunit n=1 Tax=Microbacterium TaxID=33882 RepID=UPI000A00541F|nr:DHA2 family efflux MFS transporter permease subunit [Microbacterium profundi]